MRPARAVAHGGYTVLVCRTDGSIEGPDTGLYDLDTRILSRYSLRLDDTTPRSIGSCVAVADRWASTLHIPRPGGDPEGPALPQDAWAIHVERTIGCGMAETITVRNESMVAAGGRLTHRSRRRLPRRPPVAGRQSRAGHRGPLGGRRRLGSSGSPRIDTRTARTSAGWRSQSTRRRATWRRPRRTPHTPDGWRSTSSSSRTASGRIQLTFASLVDGAWRQPADAAARPELAERWRTIRTSVVTSEALVGPAVERAADDLLALRAWELEPSDRRLGVGGQRRRADVHRLLRARHAHRRLAGGDGRPGGAPRRARGRRPDPGDAVATRGATRSRARCSTSSGAARWRCSASARIARYYGVQTTPAMFVLALSELWHWTGDDDLLRRYRDAALRAIEWAETYGDPTATASSSTGGGRRAGCKNQGWKDSDEAIRHADGRIVETPIATRRGAGVPLPRAPAHGRDPGRARRAGRSRRRAASTGPRRSASAGTRPSGCRTRGSTRSRSTRTSGRSPRSPRTPATRWAPGSCRRARRRRSPTGSSPDLFNGWGVRTLSSDHPSYNPLAYHLGTVWPVENATFALGFKRYGLDDHVDQLVDGHARRDRTLPRARLPEALTGHDRAKLPTPLPYPGRRARRPGRRAPPSSSSR